MSDIEEIYRDYFKDVFLFLRGLCRNENLSEEISQETFVKALSSIDRYNEETDIRAWLFTIAKNTYYTYCRRKNISIEEISEITAQDVIFTERIENEEQAMTIHKILHDLKEPYKEVFNLRVFGELSFEKIGEIFGKSPGWARVTYFRAKQQITEKLEGVDKL